MKYLYWLLAFIPVAFFLKNAHAADPLTFGAAALAILPLAGLMGQATDQLAIRLGPTIGGLLNASFGNATELIIGYFALAAGKFEVVKASITGSIIENLLLVLGLAVLLGGLRHRRQQFNPHAAQITASLLIIALIAVLVPALFDASEKMLALTPESTRIEDTHLALAVAIVLILLYAANLVFSLVTHRDLLAASDGQAPDADETAAAWPAGRAIGVLLAVTIAVAFMSDILIGTLEGFTTALGLSEFFVGLIIIPVIGNAAEHAAAIGAALKDKMDLAVGISLGSAVQVALLVAPLLVILSFLIGKPMDLILNNPLELATLVGAVLIGNSVARNGETNWLEGAMLISVYALVAFAFFFLPGSAG